MADLAAGSEANIEANHPRSQGIEADVPKEAATERHSQTLFGGEPIGSMPTASLRVSAREFVPERTQESPVFGPVGDREHDPVEVPRALLQRRVEVAGRTPRIVTERTTPPGPQDKVAIAVGRSDIEHASDSIARRRIWAGPPFRQPGRRT